MSDLALLAAEQWARANMQGGVDPIQFGTKVARVYLAARTTVYHAGDEKATAAALAALSIPDETLRAIALLASLRIPQKGESFQKGPTDAEGSA